MKIVLIGAAASGKDYFRDYLSHNETLDISYTTRLPREGEVESYTYNYITLDKFLKLEKENFFKESVKFNGWMYGTSLKSWEDSTVFIMTPSGTKHISYKDREECVFVYFDIPKDTRLERIKKRSDADSAERRVEADEKDFKGFSDFDIRVTNPKFNSEDLYTTIITYKKCNHIV